VHRPIFPGKGSDCRPGTGYPTDTPGAHRSKRRRDNSMAIAWNRGARGPDKRGAQVLDIAPPRLLCVALLVALACTIVSLST